MKEGLFEKCLGIFWLYLNLVNWINIVFDREKKLVEFLCIVNSIVWFFLWNGLMNFVCICMFIWLVFGSLLKIFLEIIKEIF